MYCVFDDYMHPDTWNTLAEKAPIVDDYSIAYKRYGGGTLFKYYYFLGQLYFIVLNTDNVLSLIHI